MQTIHFYLEFGEIHMSWTKINEILEQHFQLQTIKSVVSWLAKEENLMTNSLHVTSEQSKVIC